jgi:hypothetical protein
MATTCRTVWSTPALDCEGHFCAVLGAGTVTFRARSATPPRWPCRWCRPVPVPTGHAGSSGSTATAGTAGRCAGPIRTSHCSHTLVVTARGPGGTTEALPSGVYHPDHTGPTVARVWTQPGRSCRDGWCTLPPGAGVLTIHAEVPNALGRISFFLDPADSEPGQVATGYVRDGRDYSATWPYPDQPPRARLRIVAGNNVGQTNFTAFGIIHP